MRAIIRACHFGSQAFKNGNDLFLLVFLRAFAVPCQNELYDYFEAAISLEFRRSLRKNKIARGFLSILRIYLKYSCA